MFPTALTEMSIDFALEPYRAKYWAKELGVSKQV